jgi:hypothetical protein
MGDRQAGSKIRSNNHSRNLKRLLCGLHPGKSLDLRDAGDRNPYLHQACQCLCKVSP